MNGVAQSHVAAIDAARKNTALTISQLYAVVGEIQRLLICDPQRLTTGERVTSERVTAALTVADQKLANNQPINVMIPVYFDTTIRPQVSTQGTVGVALAPRVTRSDVDEQTVAERALEWEIGESGWAYTANR